MLLKIQMAKGDKLEFQRTSGTAAAVPKYARPSGYSQLRHTWVLRIVVEKLYVPATVHAQGFRKARSECHSFFVQARRKYLSTGSLLHVRLHQGFCPNPIDMGPARLIRLDPNPLNHIGIHQRG